MDEDNLYPHAWRYRDYVIDAFNRDTPFDRFIKEQLAGDLLKTNDPKERQRNVVATGFLAIGPKPLAQQDRLQMIYDVVDEQIDTTIEDFSRTDGRLRTVPRSQVRSHSDKGLLRLGFHLREHDKLP